MVGRGDQKPVEWQNLSRLLTNGTTNQTFLSNPQNGVRGWETEDGTSTLSKEARERNLKITGGEPEVASRRN